MRGKEGVTGSGGLCGHRCPAYDTGTLAGGRPLQDPRDQRVAGSFEILWKRGAPSGRPRSWVHVRMFVLVKHLEADGSTAVRLMTGYGDVRGPGTGPECVFPLCLVRLEIKLSGGSTEV